MPEDSDLTQNIPIRVRKADPTLPIPSSYSTTPHGTIFSTTPGGTRIIYDRNTLLNLRHSPLARTPPATLGFVPGITKGHPFSYNNSQVLHGQKINANLAPVVELGLENSATESGGNKDSAEDSDKHKRDTGEMFHMEM